MRTITVLWSSILAALSACSALAQTSGPAGRIAWFAPPRAAVAPQAADQKKGPQWKSTEEYNAFNAIVAEKDPKKRVSLIGDFLTKFSNSDFKANAYIAMMQSYQQLNDGPKAIDAAKKALEIDPDNLGALNYLSFAFPFVFKSTDADASAELSQTETNAKHGLEVLQKLQKPQGVSDDQFNQQVKALRANFNGTLGFVALQRKDYPAAITSFKAAAEDDPSNTYTFYREGLAYLYSSPPDYEHAFWNIARAVSLAKASGNQSTATEIEKFLRSSYVNYHGNDQGLADIMTQSASSPNPPEGFKVTPLEKPKPTGDPNIDSFNELTFPLKLGGDLAQKQWDGIKGQPLGLGGFVSSVEKGTDPGTYLVRITLDKSKVGGSYDVELKDTTQSNVKNLSPGDAVTFKGTLTAYTATPNMMLSVDGEITTDLPDKPPVKKKPKSKPKPKSRTSRPRTATHHTT